MKRTDSHTYDSSGAVKKEKLEDQATNSGESDSESAGSDDFNLDAEIQKYLNLELEGKYEITEYIAHGGFGYVFECKGLQDNSRKAVKVLMTEGDEGPENIIFNEIKISNQLRKLQNVPDTLLLAQDNLEWDSKHYIIFELMKCNLYEHVCISNKPVKVELKSVRVVFHQLCLALEFLHSQKIVHRDVKPENILVSLDSPEPCMVNYWLNLGNIKTKLSDLGNATAFKDMELSRRATQPYKSLELLYQSKYNETGHMVISMCSFVSHNRGNHI